MDLPALFFMRDLYRILIPSQNKWRVVELIAAILKSTARGTDS
jgi:hypothetical protein